MMRRGSEADCVLMAHGGGGMLMHELIQRYVLASLGGAARERSPAGGPRLSVSDGVLTDGAVLPWEQGRLVFTTDSYVVSPIEFPGGDIGRLAVCGTCNDLAVMGATPAAISLALILEEGLPLETLERVMKSAAAAALEADVEIVTGDTKVIERRGESPGMFINTAGVGRMRLETTPDVTRIRPGDAVVVNGRVAEHGLAVMSVRHGLDFETPLRSDAAPLNGMIAGLLDSGADVRFMRDATRGGVAGVLADVADGGGYSVEIDEQRVPLSSAARHASEMLGLDPLAVANEGVVVFVVAGGDAERAVAALRGNALGRHAVCMGRITERQPPLVELVTRIGGRRIVQRPYGEDLPRIC